MPSPFPSVQSFYRAEINLPDLPREPQRSHATGDGYSTSELEAALHWTPKRHYEDISIMQMETGPRNYEVTGRILNLSAVTPGKNQKQYQEACLLLVGDGTAAIAVSQPTELDNCRRFLLADTPKGQSLLFNANRRSSMAWPARYYLDILHC